jgi:hypothetical protein
MDDRPGGTIVRLCRLLDSPARKGIEPIASQCAEVWHLARARLAEIRDSEPFDPEVELALFKGVCSWRAQRTAEPFPNENVRLAHYLCECAARLLFMNSIQRKTPQELEEWETQAKIACARPLAPVAG